MSEKINEFWKDLKQIYRGKILFIILFVLLTFSFTYTKISEIGYTQNINSIKIELLETQKAYLKMSETYAKDREKTNIELNSIRNDIFDISEQVIDVSGYCEYKVDLLNEKINAIARLPKETEVTIYPGNVSEFERKLYPKIEDKSCLLFNDEKFKSDLRELNKKYNIETEKDVDQLELKDKIEWMKKYDKMIEKVKDGEYNVKTSWWQKIF